jgi:hypothetical protein
VLVDLQRPTPLDLAIGWIDGDSPGSGTLLFAEVGVQPEGQQGGGGVGVDVVRDEFAEMTVRLADQLQEQFFPESEGAWGEARPACPGHGHPAVPDVRDSAALWTCPLTGAVVGRIGALAS